MGQYKQIFKNYQDAANIVELNLNKNIAKFFFDFLKNGSASTFKNQQITLIDFSIFFETCRYGCLKLRLKPLNIAQLFFQIVKIG